jgi:exodeoxyribonuclease V gamma subunit
MSGLVIHTGNRLELLVQQLAHEIRTPLSSVFEPEFIVTQSPGMARWVSMELAQCQRVSANLVFPFPNAFLNLMCEKLSLEAPTPEDPFDPTNMTFTIMKRLPDCLSRPGYEGLRNYFDGDRRQIKLLQLSQRIAHLFDQYLVFRPDIILSWDKGKQVQDGSAWQADLWQEIASGNEHLHRVSLHADLIARLENDSAVSSVLPERISVFGISYLPVFHLQILSALSRLIPVNWYFLSPCRQYWGEVVSDRDISRLREKYASKPGNQEDLHLDRGNPLLASMGALGRDFLSMIAASGCDLQEHYVTPARNNLLNNIQADILDMLDAADPLNSAMEGSTLSSLVPTADDSIEIHACHSAMREIEVLHDHILDMFQQLSDLKPRDILVMTPDVDTYAPFIQAVFEKPVDGIGMIPFSLADRTILHQSRVMEGFFALLDLANSRMEADKIINLLEFPAIRNRFGIDEQDMGSIERWVKDLNIRWGIDADDRKDLGLPSFPENTWKSGLDRLLLGYAMPGQDWKLYAGLLPYDDMEGEQGHILGNFMEFFDCTVKAIQELETSKTLQSWTTGMQGIIDCLFLENESSEKELQALKRMLGELEKVQQMTGYADNIELDLVACHLKGELERASYGSGFLAGKVTFCAMLPMRSIPFKVICLLGMNGNAFPRDDKSLGFDLMATHPRRGDRSKRNDDKYLFLEALMSARKKLYISYVGRDIQDNSTIAPSVLVSELIDYAGSGYAFPTEHIVRQHPLQAFSADYFRGKSGLFSYSEENFAAAFAAQHPPEKPTKKMPLPKPAMALKNLSVETLGTFYVNPLKFFLQNRLGIFLAKEENLLEDSENFRLKGLEGYKTGQESFYFGIQGNRTEEMMTLFKARGVLPPGRVGEHDYAEISLEAGDFVSRVKAWTNGAAPQDKTICLQLGDFYINGCLPDVYDHGMIHVRFAKFNPRDLVRCWITHLQLCAADPNGPKKHSAYLARDMSVVYEHVDDCRDVLEHLLHSYWEGLSTPLSFYPMSAYAYARARLEQKKTQKAALGEAIAVMQGSQYKSGEIEEPYMNFYFDDTSPLDEAFEHMALDLFEPLFKHHTSKAFTPRLL